MLMPCAFSWNSRSVNASCQCLITIAELSDVAVVQSGVFVFRVCLLLACMVFLESYRFPLPVLCLSPPLLCRLPFSEFHSCRMGSDGSQYSYGLGDSYRWCDRIEVVPINHMISYMLQGLVAPPDLWEDLGVGGRGRATRLRTIPATAATYKEWQDAMETLVEYFALKLAQFQLQHRFNGDAYVLEQFDCNVGIFSKSWHLQASILNHLCTSALSDLSAEELEELRAILCFGWEPVEVYMVPGSDWLSSSSLWVTHVARR